MPSHIIGMEIIIQNKINFI
nr:hypothetical protein [Campylobacter sputorum]